MANKQLEAAQENKRDKAIEIMRDVERMRSMIARAIGELKQGEFSDASETLAWTLAALNKLEHTNNCH